MEANVVPLSRKVGQAWLFFSLFFLIGCGQIVSTPKPNTEENINFLPKETLDAKYKALDKPISISPSLHRQKRSLNKEVDAIFSGIDKKRAAYRNKYKEWQKREKAKKRRLKRRSKREYLHFTPSQPNSEAADVERYL